MSIICPTVNVPAPQPIYPTYDFGSTSFKGETLDFVIISSGGNTSTTITVWMNLYPVGTMGGYEVNKKQIVIPEQAGWNTIEIGSGIRSIFNQRLFPPGEYDLVGWITGFYGVKVAVLARIYSSMYS